MPKRLRILLRYNCWLLGSLCRLAYESICEVMQQASGNDDAVPGIVGATQTFGDLAHWHPHVHAIVSDGVFNKDGHFVNVSDVDLIRCIILWRKKIFDLLLHEEKITQEVVDSVCQWTHSGFSIDNSICIEADDQVRLQRLTEYIVRCPFSLARMIKVTDDGRVIYRTGKSNCLHFPEHGDEQLKAGMARNFQVFEPLVFLAEVTQHIPEKGQHQILYFGFYSNKHCGMRKKTVQRPPPKKESTVINEPSLDYEFFDRVCI